MDPVQTTLGRAVGEPELQRGATRFGCGGPCGEGLGRRVGRVGECVVALEEDGLGRVGVDREPAAGVVVVVVVQEGRGGRGVVEVDDAVGADVGGGEEGVHGWVVGAVVRVETEVVVAWQIDRSALRWGGRRGGGGRRGRTGDDDLGLVGEISDPGEGFGELVGCTIVGHVPSVDEHIAVGDVACEVIVVRVRDADDADPTGCGGHGRAGKGPLSLFLSWSTRSRARTTVCSVSSSMKPIYLVDVLLLGLVMVLHGVGAQVLATQWVFRTVLSA